MSLHKAITLICLLRTFFQTLSKDLDLRNTKPILGHNLAKELTSESSVSFPSISIIPSTGPICHGQAARGTVNLHFSDGDWYSQYELSGFQKSQEHVPHLVRYPIYTSDLPHIQNLNSCIIYITEWKVTWHTFQRENWKGICLQRSFQLWKAMLLWVYIIKNNKGASMGQDRGGCCRENDSHFPKWKPETRKEMFKTELKKFTDQDS